MSIFLVILSGVLTAFSLPTRFAGFQFPELGFLAWFSLAPLFFVIRNKGPRQAFLYCFVSFFVCYSISLYWLYTALNTFGGLPPYISVGVLFLLMIILAAFISFAPMLAAWIEGKIGLSRFWTIPVLWVVCEILRNYYPFGGFPWGNLTNSQYTYLPVIQIADITGVYGLLFVMIAFNLWIADRFANGCSCSWLGSLRSKRTIYVLSMVFVVLTYGYVRVNNVEMSQANASSIRTALLQVNIPQGEKWLEGFEEQNLKIYQDMAGELIKLKLDLIVWPEAAYPYSVSSDKRSIPKERLGFAGTPGGSDTFTLLGAVAFKNVLGERLLTNSLFLLDDNGEILGRYDKAHLVPFGEYVPHKKLFFFAKKLVAPVGSFVAGVGPDTLFTDKYIIGPLICYEDLFPEIARSSTKNGADLLAVVTNDAWYGDSSAARQHLAISVFRSVENRRWMVRSANTGISAVVSSTGKILSATGIFERGFIISQVKLDKTASIYTRYGDFFAWGCAVVALALMGLSLAKRKEDTK